MNELDTLKKFGSSFQTKVISVLLSDKTFLERVYDIVHKDFFESSAQQWIVENIISYYLSHKEIPTKDVFKVKINEIGDSENLKSLKKLIVDEIKIAYQKKDDSDIKFISDEFLTFCKNQKIKQAIIESADLLVTGDYENIKIKVDEALKAGAERNIGYDYNNDIEARMSNIIRNCIKTGWKSIDQIMDGGLGSGELAVCVAPAGIGKSWVLCHIGSEALKQGKNVLHVTLELNEKYVGKRYDSCLTSIDFQDITKPENFGIIKNAVEKIEGKLFIKYFPLKTVSPNSIKIHIERIQNVTGKKIDLLVVDYADILRPFASEKGSNSYNTAGNIYEELRTILGELQIPGWTASQTNRGGSSQEIVQAENVSDSFVKIMTSDFIMSLSRLLNDKANNTGRFHIIKNRFGPDGMTYNSKMNTSNGQIDLYDMDSEEGMSISKSFVSEEEATKKYIKNKWMDKVKK